jgi:hypothetical protein
MDHALEAAETQLALLGQPAPDVQTGASKGEMVPDVGGFIEALNGRLTYLECEVDQLKSVHPVGQRGLHLDGDGHVEPAPQAGEPTTIQLDGILHAVAGIIRESSCFEGTPTLEAEREGLRLLAIECRDLRDWLSQHKGKAVEAMRLVAQPPAPLSAAQVEEVVRDFATWLHNNMVNAKPFTEYRVREFLAARRGEQKPETPPIDYRANAVVLAGAMKEMGAHVHLRYLVGSRNG